MVLGFFKRREFVVRDLDFPLRDLDSEEELDWICQSLGFFEPRDRDRTASRIFKIVFRESFENPLGSDEIAERVGVSRGAVINHLNRMMESGLVRRRGTKYVLRSRSLERTLGEMLEEVERAFRHMERIAKELDERMFFSKKKR